MTFKTMDGLQNTTITIKFVFINLSINLNIIEVYYIIILLLKTKLVLFKINDLYFDFKDTQ